MALVGTTGSGKSTVGGSLFRFYDVTGGGGMTIDGEIVRRTSRQEEPARQYRRGAAGHGAVQRHDLLQDTPMASDGAQPAREVDGRGKCLAACANDFIVSLRRGLRHRGGRERGLKLSAGKSSAWAIARYTLLKGRRRSWCWTRRRARSTYGHTTGDPGGASGYEPGADRSSPIAAIGCPRWPMPTRIRGARRQGAMRGGGQPRRRWRPANGHAMRKHSGGAAGGGGGREAAWVLAFLPGQARAQPWRRVQGEWAMDSDGKDPRRF